MVISSLYGRTDQGQEDELCQAKVAEYRERFLATFGTLTCGKLREEKYGSDGEEPCSVLVERASNLILEVIE
jgi:hypothetical protein